MKNITLGEYDARIDKLADKYESAVIAWRHDCPSGGVEIQRPKSRGQAFMNH
jgi:hypothetical protein